jgi:hypothetical protein
MYAFLQGVVVKLLGWGWLNPGPVLTAADQSAAG